MALKKPPHSLACPMAAGLQPPAAPGPGQRRARRQNPPHGKLPSDQLPLLQRSPWEPLALPPAQWEKEAVWVKEVHKELEGGRTSRLSPPKLQPDSALKCAHPLVAPTYLRCCFLRPAKWGVFRCRGMC